MLLRCLLAVATIAFTFAARVDAQGRLDSLFVLQTLASELRKDARTVVQWFACHDGSHPYTCPNPDASTPNPLIRDFAEKAGAQLVDRGASGVPPCPWETDPPTRPGFRISIARITFRGDTARVLVLRHCRATAGVHRAFAQDDEYELVRDLMGDWTVRGQRMLRITSGHARGHRVPADCAV